MFSVLGVEEHFLKSITEMYRTKDGGFLCYSQYLRLYYKFSLGFLSSMDNERHLVLRIS